ncbi:ATP-binding protein [Desulfomarina profundi]|uniref:ATP-binding protein n=1 Tax=Desulfomarina profundi TaxID=2772557 RepID=UPI001E302EEB|nr:DUF87 domain-containing protein [Desulfomarina profundi]
MNCLESREVAWSDNQLLISGGCVVENQYPYEKLGLLYLGREMDLRSGQALELPFLYKNKYLTTHAAIIGMTGSGKTGLGVALIEEAIMDNIPSIIIDPKGDMGNLLLTFPELQPEDFIPWIDPAEAAGKEMSVPEYGEKVAASWKKGLASWGQGPERIRQLRTRTDMTIYTPGSTAGVPVSVLSSFKAPSEALLADTDTLNSLVNSTTTTLLSLIDIKGDPLQSREHILLSSLLLHFWRKGEDLSLENLIGAIVNPPFDKVGVFGLDAFYNQSQRMSLAMSLNNILASPTFAAWTEGVPLDIQRILYSEEGRPQTAIFSIAHLSETERMFFVTMLLNQFTGWMRRQQGSASLKALLYMDEIFGYFPPTANPPSKKPMLLLLKQARAYGVGIVLATQNPVDLDYKGLSNIGSWFIGRLQTSQDQDRVVEGIVGAGDGHLDARLVRNLLSDMKSRQFLLNSAHMDEPTLFETRWVMSYLKGPISKNDITKLMKGRKDRLSAAGGESNMESVAAVSRNGAAGPPPLLGGNIEQLYYLQNMVSDEINFEPYLWGRASVRYFNNRRNIDVVQEVSLRLYLDEDFKRADWENGEEPGYGTEECVSAPPENGGFYPLPASIAGLRSMTNLKKEFSDFLYQNRRQELFRIKGTSFESTPDESLGDFRVRFSDSLREQKEDAVEKLREKYELKQERIEKKLQTALHRLEKEKVDVKTKTTDSLISFGVAVVGAFFGRKALSASTIGKAATGMRSVGRVAKERSDVKRAEENVLALQQELDDLSVEIEERVTELAEQYSIDNCEIETFSIKPRRSDIFDVHMVLLWEMVA